MQHQIRFGGHILILGCGSVAQCTIPLVLRHLEMSANRITVMDMRDNRALIAAALERGVTYVHERLTKDKFHEQLGRYLGPGDILLDLAWNLQTLELLEWCRQHGVCYINTSVEVWDPYEGMNRRPLTEQTLYHRHMQLREMIARWGDNKGPTAVLDHGANPGLVSHFTKRALIEIGQRIIEDSPRDARVAALRQAIERQQFSELARLSGVKVIHVSERDSQRSNRPKDSDEFVNTWSVEGLYEEGIAPAELGWGTHERRLPADAQQHAHGPQNQICLERRGMNTWVRSWCPSGEIRGMVIRHGEAFSISERLTCLDERGDVIYRPTVHYAYSPCEDAMGSLDELRLREYRMHGRERILRNEIVSGRDELGCLLMGHDYNSWWVGSVLDINETRRLVPGQTPTTLQVASSLLGALFWMIGNPHEGVNLPDDLPHEVILRIAMPYLGPFRSYPVDWSPNGYCRDGSTGNNSIGHNGSLNNALPINGDDHEPWQFEHFLIAT
ncbi:MAG TPA: saccharopine dehydrogenase NADP-binding domain-containing protein, partial [Planctomycetaceae bacterium]|nr:saccharopine dehydrogenase NADP-binding domain-containing protein [Planctomycetaceae bacterium]